MRAPSLSARLLTSAAREGVMHVLPFWADGGTSGSTDSVLAPAGHVIAAYPSEVVRARLEDLGGDGLVPFLRRHLPPASDERLPLVVVLLAYDAGRAAPGHESLMRRPERERQHAHDGLPEVLVVRYDGYLEAPSEEGPWTSVGDTRKLEHALQDGTLDAQDDGAERAAIDRLQSLSNDADPSRYFAGFEAILAGIRNGDHYQVNLARRLVAGFTDQTQPRRAASHPEIAIDFASSHKLALAKETRMLTPDTATLIRVVGRLHAALRATQPAAFGALMPLDEDAWLISGSPECLLEWRAHTRLAQSFPIKGTIARADSSIADGRLSQLLRGSIKDQAEHVMIVDLVRNDLGRVAVPGSVAVPSLFSELALRTVRHLVSEVRATLANPYDLADLIGALFPGGSITGAPKIAAMHALDRWETFKRGVYCGSLGVVRGGQRATMSILIRTAVASAHGLTFGTGGGLVADSDAAAELAETELKAAAINAAIAAARTPKKLGEL